MATDSDDQKPVEKEDARPKRLRVRTGVRAGVAIQVTIPVPAVDPNGKR